MNLYPAIEAKMGSWKYYIVKMKMRELASDVKFAAEIYEDRTLDDAIQRELNESRIKKEIVSFLARRPDRFFAAIVVASLGGAPKFYPVRITGDEKFEVFVDQGLDQAYGVLTFSGEQKYYALDGQHRLKAIKTLLDRTAPESQSAPERFSEEEICVLMIVRQEDWDSTFLQSYRRLFSSLNRYAKPTNMDTNIIMDEDDAFAILTRRLITEYEFFLFAGRQKESARVQTKGKNLTSGDHHFTSLQTLYAMNEHMLAADWRENVGWGLGNDAELERDTRAFKRFRPDEDYLDQLYEELRMYWDVLLETIPDLRKEPTSMRIHDPESIEGGDGSNDHLLFWPIGQELLAKVVRRLLDRKLPDPRDPNREAVLSALECLGKVDWDLHKPPWRYLLLVHDVLPRDRWHMRNEDRKEVLVVAERLLKWLLGIDELRPEEVEELEIAWQSYLSPTQEPDHIEEMWRTVTTKRAEIAKSLA